MVNTNYILYEEFYVKIDDLEWEINHKKKKKKKITNKIYISTEMVSQ
jgi:hypothetical protein